MFSYSSLILVAVAFGFLGPIVSAEPYRLIRTGNIYVDGVGHSDSISNDGISNDAASEQDLKSDDGTSHRVRQNIELVSLTKKKKRNGIFDVFDVFPGLTDDFSMPSTLPTDGPSLYPSYAPTHGVSPEPSRVTPTTPSLPLVPTKEDASNGPTFKPSATPSNLPSVNLSFVPSDGPSLDRSDLPSDEPSFDSSNFPSDGPSLDRSDSPSDGPSLDLSSLPSDGPSLDLSNLPSGGPSFDSSGLPSSSPSLDPSSKPTEIPSEDPTFAVIPSNNKIPIAGVFSSESPTFVATEYSSENSTFELSEFSSENFTASPTVSNLTDDDDDFFEDSSTSTQVSPSNFTSAPSVSPTIEECKISEDERAAQIFVLLDAAGNSTTNRDLNTPQGLAADWLINQDFRKECPSEKIVQRWIIAVFYFSTSGDLWEKCSAAGSDPCGSQFPFTGERRFLSDFSECEWAGITCNDDDCVTEIEFEENGLVGTIPTELGLLEELAVLGMERGGLSSTIPSEIGLLTKLVFMDLDFNQLTGSLPTTLFSLTDLETLDLNDNLLEGDIGLIGVFENLQFLQLQSNLFTGTVPEQMGNLTMMTTFNLHENLFSGTMPESICDLREDNGGLLKSLIADCGNRTGFGPDIECDCCSSCRG